MSVLTEIINWASGQPYWERAALSKIMAHMPLTDADYDELLGYLLEDVGLEKSTGPRPVLCFPDVTRPDSSAATPMKILKISNLQNVNALVPDQVLTFEPRGLTAIFGANGSGKSGYARVLGCAGFTRGDRQVLPNVTQPINKTVGLSADIEVEDEAATRSIHYKIGCACPELSTFYVFDSTSVRVHMSEENPLSFSPAGLSYLPELAEVTDAVRSRLRTRIDEFSRPHEFAPLFLGESEVSALIAKLSPTTDLGRLHELATLPSDAQQQIERLDLEIARLKLEDTTQEIASLEQRQNNLTALVGRLRAVQEHLGDEAVRGIFETGAHYDRLQTETQQLSADVFKSEHFRQAGSDAWYEFMRATRRLAEEESAVEELAYPQPESRCLLCQQPLSRDAYELLLRLWKFLEGEAQAKLEEAQTCYQARCEALRAVELDFFNEQSAAYQFLREKDPQTLSVIRTFLQACLDRRGVVLASVSPDVPGSMSPLPQNGIQQVEEILRSLADHIALLKSRNRAAEIAGLERQKLELEHRVVLARHLERVEDYIKKRIWARSAAKVGGSTKHITQKHNELFERLVTDRYVKLFEETLCALGRPLQVKVDTKGKKGQVYKRIALEADQSAQDIAAPDKVLSEGEKRAVALADYLTEVALDTSSSGIILDDPVTSLDLEWRQTIAAILAAQAQDRQVIVFTHDLPFLYFLTAAAQAKNVPTASHWIKRGEHDGKPGYVFLDNSPALESDYRKTTRAQQIYAQAKAAPPELQERLLRDGFGALRTNYEAFIVFDLFQGVVQRFNERISFGPLTDIVWDDSIAQEVVAKCEYLSRYIEGHLHSDMYAAVKPTPQMLMEEISAFNALKSRHKGLKKS